MVARARSGCANSSFLAGALLLAAALGAAITVGASIGALSSLLDPASRQIVEIGATTSVLAGAVTRRKPWQLDRETPGRWLTLENWRTAVYNGAALGVGVTTRIGFWLFYALIFGAVQLGSPALGGHLFVLYALTRVGLSLLQVAAGQAIMAWVNLGGLSILGPITDLYLFFLAGHILVAAAS